MARRRFRIGIVVSCLFLALVLWGFVTLTRTYEDEVMVPLTIVAPANQALLSTIPTEVAVNVRGTGLQILTVKYLNRSTVCTVDLAKLNASAQGVYTVDQEQFVRGISSPEQLRILSVFPASLTMATGDLFVKAVPVKLRTNIVSRDGFSVIGVPASEPSTVEIRGTKSVVEGIQSWPTKRIAIADLHKPVSEVIEMSDSLTTLLNVVPPRIRVNIDVQQQTNIAIHDVPITVELDQQVHISPSHISITVSGGVEELSNLTLADVSVSVPSGKSGYVRPVITVPPSVQVVASDPPWLRVISMASP